jgi:hypothetical protein
VPRHSHFAAKRSTCRNGMGADSQGHNDDAGRPPDA